MSPQCGGFCARVTGCGSGGPAAARRAQRGHRQTDTRICCFLCYRHGPCPAGVPAGRWMRPGHRVSYEGNPGACLRWAGPCLAWCEGRAAPSGQGGGVGCLEEGEAGGGRGEVLLSFGRRFSRLIHAELPHDSPGDMRGLEKHPCLWLPWMRCPLPPPAFMPPGRTSSLRAMFQDQEAPLRPHGPILGSEPAPAPGGQPWLSQEHGYQGGAGLGLPDWGAAGLRARTQLWTVIDLLQPAESGDTPGGPPWATWRGGVRRRK